MRFLYSRMPLAVSKMSLCMIQGDILCPCINRVSDAVDILSQTLLIRGHNISPCSVYNGDFFCFFSFVCFFSFLCFFFLLFLLFPLFLLFLFLVLFCWSVPLEFLASFCQWIVVFERTRCFMNNESVLTYTTCPMMRCFWVDTEAREGREEAV